MGTIDARQPGDLSWVPFVLGGLLPQTIAVRQPPNNEWVDFTIAPVATISGALVPTAFGAPDSLENLTSLALGGADAVFTRENWLGCAGGPILWFWDPAIAAADDNRGTVAWVGDGIHTPGTLGGWVAQYYGPADIRWFGAGTINTAAQNTVGIHRAWAAADSTVMPPGLFLVETLNWERPGCTFLGAGPASQLRSSEPVALQVGTWDAVGLAWRSGGYGLFGNLTIAGGAVGAPIGGSDALVVLDLSIETIFRDLYVQDSAGHGIWSSGGHSVALLNFVQNGTFADGSFWTAGANWVLGGGFATATAATSLLTQANALPALNQVVTLEFDVTGITPASFIVVFYGTNLGIVLISNGHIKTSGVCLGNTTLTFSAVNFTGTITNVETRPAGNNDGIQTPGARVWRCAGSPLFISPDCADNNLQQYRDVVLNVSGNPTVIRGSFNRLIGDVSYCNPGNEQVWLGHSGDTAGLLTSYGNHVEAYGDGGMKIKTWPSDQNSSSHGNVPVTGTGLGNCAQIGRGVDSTMLLGHINGTGVEVGAASATFGSGFVRAVGQAMHVPLWEYGQALGAMLDGFYGASRQGSVDGTVPVLAETIAAGATLIYFVPIGDQSTLFGGLAQHSAFPAPPGPLDPVALGFTDANGAPIPEGLVLENGVAQTDWGARAAIRNRTAAPIALPAGRLSARALVTTPSGGPARVANERIKWLSQVGGAPERSWDARIGVQPTGTAVTTWLDGIDALASAAGFGGLEPTIVRDALGRQWIRSNGSQYFTLVGAWPAGTIYTLGCFINPSSAAPWKVLASWGAARMLLLANGTSEVAVWTDVSSMLSTGAAAVTGPQLLIYEFNSAGGGGVGECKVYRAQPGVPLAQIGATITPIAIDSRVSATWLLGAQAGGLSIYAGDYGEFFSLGRLMTPTERLQQEARGKENWWL